jgi:hypothetical protein
MLRIANQFNFGFCILAIARGSAGNDKLVYTDHRTVSTKSVVVEEVLQH